MSIHNVWVHGNTVRAQWIADRLTQVRGDNWDASNVNIPYSDFNGSPTGWGTTFRGKRSITGGVFGGTNVVPDPTGANPFAGSRKGYWFHFAIPTTQRVAGIQTTVQRAYVTWASGPKTEMAAIHLWDGPNRFYTHNFAENHGNENHGTEVTENKTAFSFPPHPMLFGLGISVGVSFLEDSEITFFGAGADFEIACK